MDCQEHNYVHLRTERFKYTDEQGNKCVDVRELFFCSKCLDQRQVLSTYSKPTDPPADDRTDFEKRIAQQYLDSPDATREEVMDAAASCSEAIKKVLVGNPAVLAQFIRFSGLILKVSRSVGLNPDDHFPELIAARSTAIQTLKSRS